LIGSGEVTLTNLIVGTPYHFEIAAVNYGNLTSDYSSVYNFTTDVPHAPDAPTDFALLSGYPILYENGATWFAEADFN
jgi:hypothetical protein